MATAEYWRNWRKAHPEQARGYTRKYRESHLEQERERARKRYAANPEKARESQRNWYKANREKKRAQLAMQRAIKAGKLVREPCVICGNLKSEKHHPDYAKPLDGVDLCHLHHGYHHRIMP